MGVQKKNPVLFFYSTKINLLCVSKYFNMKAKDYLKDIRDIKDMMSKSTQFISLSGLSGVLAGIYALVGAYLAQRIVPVSDTGYEYSGNAGRVPVEDIIRSLTIIAIGIIVLSIITGIVLSAAKAKRHGEKLWNSTSKRLLINFSIPLIAGGIFSLQLVAMGIYGLIAPVMLLFYGMACINASKYTFRDVRYLGITLIILGLIAVQCIGYGLLFWTIGFGVCHVIYGSLMYFKYDNK